jgi:hypothetical protein
MGAAGVQSATNLAGSIVESRMLGIWERERTQIGLAMRPDLVERLAFVINKGWISSSSATRQARSMIRPRSLPAQRQP